MPRLVLQSKSSGKSVLPPTTHQHPIPNSLSTAFDGSRKRQYQKQNSAISLYQQVKVKNEQGLGLTHPIGFESPNFFRAMREVDWLHAFVYL